MELWELAARERIRDTLALYHWSGDAFRLGELAEAFCPDGRLELRGHEPLRGRAAIVAFLSGSASGSGAVSASAGRGGSGPGGDRFRPADDDARRAAAKAAAEAGGTRRVVRHVLANVRFVELAPDRARVASYFTVVTEIGLDHFGRYRDTFVPVGDAWLIEHRYVSTDWRAPASTMAPPSAVG